MPRIRSIKPEFFDSPSTASASFEARLFFIALWCWADDYGVGTAAPKQLIAFAFPNDPITDTDFPRLRTEVATAFGVQWYEVDGRPYYCIPSWDDHQKNERRANRKNPAPDQGILIDTETHGTSVQSHGDSGTGTGEQGNRGTGETRPSSDRPSDDEQRDERGTPTTDRKQDRRSAPRSKQSVPLPDDWKPTDAHRERARTSRLDVEREAVMFRSNALAKDLRYVEWNSAFTTWLLRAETYRSGSPAPAVPQGLLPPPPQPPVRAGQTW